MVNIALCQTLTNVSSYYKSIVLYTYIKLIPRYFSFTEGTVGLQDHSTHAPTPAYSI